MDLRSVVRLIQPTIFLLLIFMLNVGAANAAEDQYLRVQVTEPYLEMYTGPGRGFPRFYSVERGEWVEVISRKTDWFQVRTRKGKKGWVKRAELEKARSMSGSQLVFGGSGDGDFLGRRIELGFVTGVLEDDPLIGLRAAWYLTDGIALEGAFSHVPGEFSRSFIYSANVVMQPYPEWKYSPYVSLGAGTIENEPKATLIGVRDTDATVWSAALGVRRQISGKFMFRLEVRDHQALVNSFNNQNLLEITAGVSFFY